MQAPTFLSTFFIVWRLSQIGQLKTKTWLGSVEPIRLEIHLCVSRITAQAFCLSPTLPRTALFCWCFAFWCYFESCMTSLRLNKDSQTSSFQSLQMLPPGIKWDCYFFFFLTAFSVYLRFVSFWVSCKVPRREIANPSCFLFLWWQSKLACETQFVTF